MNLNKFILSTLFELFVYCGVIKKTLEMKILIIDIETTGFLPKGKIVEFGAVELDILTGDKKVVADIVINPELPIDVLENSWIVQNGYMSVDEILNGKLWYQVNDSIQALINSHPDGATAFNRQFDFKFLESYGIRFPKKLPCPMLFFSKHYSRILKGKYQRISAEDAYNAFFIGVNYTEIHRGPDDALHEADIVFKLNKLTHFII